MYHFTGTFHPENSPGSGSPKEAEGSVTPDSPVCSPHTGYAKKEKHQLWLAGEVHNLEGDANSKALSLLETFRAEGTCRLKRYDGEFTLIIRFGSETLIARDRHGAGPQVFYTENHFSDSLKNLLQLRDCSPEPNHEALLIFLSTGYIPSPLSSIKGVSKLPAGSILRSQNGKQECEHLADWEDFYHAASRPADISEEEATRQYGILHRKAIEERIRGKNHIGLLLSGGYDSGGNMAGLREIYDGKVSTYSIGFKDNPWSELPLAKLLSARYNTKHQEYLIDGTEIRDLPEIVETLGDPFQEGGLMVNYAAMKLIGEDKPEIILGGDGNDQHFGTAGKELALHYIMGKKGLQPFQKIYSALGKLPAFNHDNLLFRTWFHNEKIIRIMESDQFGFKKHDLQKMVKDFNGLPKPKFPGLSPGSFQNFDHLFLAHNFFSDIGQVINEVILFKASRMAGMFSNKLTYPYMSTEIYQFLKNMPREYKLNGELNDLAKGGGISKFLHKNHYRPKLPPEITDRKKQGGFAPLSVFFNAEPQRRRLRDFIYNSGITGDFLTEKTLTRFFETYEKTTRQQGYWFWYKQVKAFQFFNLLVLAVWWEIFINNKNPEEIKTLL